MAKLPKIIPISDLRADAATALKSVKGRQGPVIITQRGRATAVLISMEAYEARERERSILRELLRGEREIKAGKGVDVEDVLREVDELLDSSE
jgi:prevent-host-death family protein